MAYEKTVWVNGQAPALDAEHLNKIEQGIADAVSVTPQTLSDGQKAQARGNINAAPGGFGLGGAAKMLTAADNVDNIRASGWYTWSLDPTKQPAGLPDEAKYHTGLMRVDSANPVTYDNVQTIYIIYSPPTPNPGDQCVIQRMGLTAPNVWNPWEWVNPPMILGTEYRTTERYLGKPVYVKALNVSSLPNNSNISVNIAANSDGSADETIRAITAYGVTSNGNSIPAWAWSRDPAKKIYLQLYLWIVYLETTFDASSEGATIVVKYTKTTD